MDSMETSALSLPVEFHALHFDAASEEFFYDPEQLQHYDTGPEKCLHLHKAALMVEDWIRLLEHEQTKRGQPLRDMLHDQQPFMAATDTEGAWKLGGGLTKAEKLKLVEFLEGQKADFA